MGMIANLATGLMATRVKTDLEFKLGSLSERRMAVLDKSNEVSVFYSNSIFTPTKQDDVFYEQQLLKLQTLDKELNNQMRQLETQLKIYTEIKEDQLKGSKQNAKKEFTVDA